MDGITTSLLNMSLFPSFNLSTLFMETNAAGGIQQPKQARQNVHISGGAWASIRSHGMGVGINPMSQLQNSGGHSAHFYFSSRPLLSPFLLMIQINKQKTALRPKEYSGRLWCACGKPIPTALLWGIQAPPTAQGRGEGGNEHWEQRQGHTAQVIGTAVGGGSDDLPSLNCLEPPTAIASPQEGKACSVF